MTTNTGTARLTDQQAQAIADYATAHGRNWKMRLRNDWETGRASAELQSVRNTFGPSWLVSYRLGGR